MPVQILGINGIGHEADNALMVDGRKLPWLQDRDGVNVWSSWVPDYRDVVVLDVDNRRVYSYNLTSHNLAEAANAAELEALLVDLANGEPPRQ